MSSSRRSGVVRPLLVFAAFLLCIELAVRAFVPHYSSRNFFLTLFGDPPDTTPTAGQQQPLFEGDATRFWRLRADAHEVIWDFTVVSTNDQGLRHAKSITAKPTGQLRIVCVGDSVTFGYRIPLVFPNAPDQYDHEDAPYCGRLEKMLRAEMPERDVEVILLAVPGYSSYQGRIMLEQTIGWLDPDIVFICFGFNDVAQKPFPDKEVMSRDFVPTTLRGVLSSSQTLLHAWRWWTSRPAQRSTLPEPGPRVAREDYVANIEAMVALAREHGAAVLVIGPVYRDRTTNPPEAQRMSLYRATLRDAMLSKGIPYLQIDQMTEAANPGNESLFGEHIHPSSNGHQLMAERVLDALRTQGALAEKLGSRGAAS